MSTKKLNQLLQAYRRAIAISLYLCAVVLAYFFAFIVRFDFTFNSSSHREVFFLTLPYLVVIQMATFWFFRAFFSGMWRYASLRDFLSIFRAVTIGSLLFMATVVLLFEKGFVSGFSRSIFVLDWLLLLFLICGIHLLVRLFIEYRNRAKMGVRRRIVIFGANDAGEALIREIERNPHLPYDVVGVVDDNPSRQGIRIHGVKVLGGEDDLPRICAENQVQEVIVATPLDEPARRRRILTACIRSGVPFKKLPPVEYVLKDKNGSVNLQDFNYEDLFDRVPASISLEDIQAQVQGRRVLVTGAGGSIGTELCRQLARMEPDVLVLYERAESALYYIQIALKDEFPKLRTVSVVGDILNRKQLREVLTAHYPNIIYHAAAYKHVPLMENQPIEAIENNVFGTESVALEAMEGGVERFVFISTDKAVNPVGIMGMTKYLAECMLQSMDGVKMSYVSVRFGNVIGSHGSVLPLFGWQILKGGPVTITDPGVTRYFMNVSEAAQLVIYAGCVGKTGEVYYLDMGMPVQIMELARTFIRSFGYEPGQDIPFEFVGLRPGERLKEELVMEGEEIISNDFHRVIKLKKTHFRNRDTFKEEIEELRALVQKRDREGAMMKLKAMVEVVKLPC